MARERLIHVRDRKLQVALLILILTGALALPAVSGVPAPLPSSLTPRGPIAITSDADFTASNGVVSGTGSPFDPYVISGWHITTGSGAAITIRDVSASFIVRDNLVETSQSASGIVIARAAGDETVQNNQVRVESGTGIRLASSDALTRDNTVQGVTRSYGAGIVATAFHGSVIENVVANVRTGVSVQSGAPVVEGNNIGVTGYGIVVSDVAVGTRVNGNVVANVAGPGIQVTRATHVQVANNLVEHVRVGIDASACVELDVEGNDVHATRVAAATFATCNLTVSANLFQDGVLGVDVSDSDIRFLNNTVQNHLDVGVTFRESEGLAYGNTVTLNGGGIRLTDGLVVRLVQNTLTDNTWGLDIPYAARQSIPYLEGNFVNGFNVDGTVVPQDKAWFYKDANVLVSGVVFDSGFTAGYYGAMSVQGGIVLYEVDTAVIENVQVSHQRIGVHAVNSFNVQVTGSQLTTNGEGVVLEAIGVSFDVPHCVGFVKNSTIEIPVDPAGTVGVRVEDCHAGVYDNVIRLVDVGVTFDAGASGEIVGNSIVRTTKVGVHLQGSVDQRSDVVLVVDNTVALGRTGARLEGSGSTWIANTITGNSRTGMELTAGAHPVLKRNNVSLNLNGIVDLDACTMRPSCAHLVLAEENEVYANAGTGLRVYGGGVLRANTFIANGFVGAEAHGEVEFTGNVVAHTESGNGAHLSGAVTLRDSLFHGNAKNGLLLQGDANLRDSTFVANGEAGIRMDTRWVTALRLNVSANLDGIVVQEFPPNVTVTVTPPSIYVNPGGLLPSLQPPRPSTHVDPLFIHRSIIEDNERNAIRAGAAVVNASYNWWGDPEGPGVDTGVTGAFGNTVSPHVYTFPWYTDRQMTTTGPVQGL